VLPRDRFLKHLLRNYQNHKYSTRYEGLGVNSLRIEFGGSSVDRRVVKARALGQRETLILAEVEDDQRSSPRSTLAQAVSVLSLARQTHVSFRDTLSTYFEKPYMTYIDLKFILVCI
jgi:hypothetical protein